MAIRGARRRWRTPCALVLCLLCGLLAAPPGALASTKTQLARARTSLAQAERSIRSAGARLRAIERQERVARKRLSALQGSLNGLAARVERAQIRYSSLRQQVRDTQARIRQAERSYHRLRSRLSQWARISYEQGPASELGIVLQSNSLADLSDRLEFVDRVAQATGDLANEVQDRANQLRERKAQLRSLAGRAASALAVLRGHMASLQSRLKAEQRVYAQLAAARTKASQLAAQLSAKRRTLEASVSRLGKRLRAEQIAAARAASRQAASTAGRATQVSVGPSTGGGPLQFCPVQGPLAFTDDFGAPRYGGGFHLHAGIDIMASTGTPVIAPFDGTTANASNATGGLAVIVRGSQGWVLNAHLSRFGASGYVKAGTVIGYVGETGDATGPHDHFEWHPNVIPPNPYRSAYGQTVIDGAIDSYPYLRAVC